MKLNNKCHFACKELFYLKGLPTGKVISQYITANDYKHFDWKFPSDMGEAFEISLERY